MGKAIREMFISPICWIGFGIGTFVAGLIAPNSAAVNQGNLTRTVICLGVAAILSRLQDDTDKK